MTPFAIFATLLAVQFASGFSEYEEVRQLRIRREPSVSGEGSLRDHQTNARTYSFGALWDAAYAEKLVEVEPSSVRIVEGYRMHVKFKDAPTNWTSCNIAAPNETKFNMEDCEFRAFVNRTDSGWWTLTAFVNNSAPLTGKVNVSVYEDREESREMEDVNLKCSAEGKLEPVTGNITFCQLKDPKGVQTPLIIGTCQYNISVVTPRHEGNWTVVYGTEGKIIPMRATFRVTTYFDWTIDGSVNLTEDNKTQLLCRVNVSEPQALEFCHFTRPDGHVLSLSPGIGNERYETSKISEPGIKTNNLDCGLIIHSRREGEDYGAWRCRITDKQRKSYGTVLHLNSDIGNKTRVVAVIPNVVARKVYVKENDSYQIKCTANVALSYCWFRSPNGTAYSISQSKVRTPFSLPYVGSGLPLGDCAAEIDHASFTDHGEWTCNVGVVNGPEERQSFTVHVAESYVIPSRAKLIATRTDNIILSCNILPNVTDRAVHYCRWIRPDGYGIYSGVSHRYMTNTSNTWCKLIIQGNNHTIEDLGNWTCVAGLMGAKSMIEESQATVIVYPELMKHQTIVGVTVALSMMLMIMVTALSLVQLCKRFRALPADPPPYTVQAIPIPRFMKAECDSKVFRY